MEALEVQWEQFKLMEDEICKIDVDEGLSEDERIKEKRSVIGKIIVNCIIGLDIIKTTMNKIWRISRSSSFKEVGDNLFIITFATELDKQRVLDGQSWLFDNQLFVLKHLEVNSSPISTSFDLEVFWVQFHHLSVRCMNSKYGELVGVRLEKFMKLKLKWMI